MTTSSPRPANRRAARIAFFALPVLAGALALAWSLRPGGDARSSADALYTVKKGDLRISVVESGTLKATKSVDIVSELEGQSVVLHLVPEGTHVEEGELIAELDASNLEERATQQHISHEKARASWVEAKENFEIQKNQCESDIKEVELKVVFAETDLKKYVEGDEPKAMNEATSAIMLAEEELKRAKDKRDWSEKLSVKGYVTRTELEADDLQVKKRVVDLDSARQEKDLLEKYEHPKQRKKLTSDLEEAKKELERVQRKARAELARAEANLNAQKATYDLEESRLKKLETQLGKAKIYAPASGMVVYASTSRGRFDRDERPVEEGASVRERQLLVSLPDMSSMTALTKIHESSLSKVRRGMPAFVTVDAMKDGRFEGKVAKVAMLPDSQSTWLNPDLKVYSAEIVIPGNEGVLRPGMSCSVEVVGGELHDVLQMPLQAAHPRGSRTFCYVDSAGRAQLREIQVGDHNSRMVHVVAGLTEGERVYLYVPKDAPELPKAPAAEAAPPDPAVQAGPPSDPGDGERRGRGRRGGGSPGGGPGGGGGPVESSDPGGPPRGGGR